MWLTTLRAGVETCPSYAPTGTQEIHISGDVAVSVWQYWQATRDLRSGWLREVSERMVNTSDARPALWVGISVAPAFLFRALVHVSQFLIRAFVRVRLRWASPCCPASLTSG